MTGEGRIRLRVITASNVEIDTEVDQVTAEAPDGSFTMLPRHIDIVTALDVGLLAYSVDGKEHLVAVDGGVLVKQGSRIEVASAHAVAGDSDAELERTLREQFLDLDEQEKRSRTALARLEHDVVTRMIDLSEDR